MQHHFRAFLAILCCLLVIFSQPKALASPWIDASDDRMRTQIQFLADRGILDSALMTWPLSWSALATSLNQIDKATLDTSSRRLVSELSFELRRQRAKSIKKEVSVGASKSRPLIRRFGSDFRERAELSHTFEWDGDWLALGLTSTLADDAGGDDYQSYWDGSYIAATAGSIAFGFGARDRWWGPGWQSSLILSTNARPVPSIFAESLKPFRSESPWLSWLGAMSWSTFIGQLDSNREIPEAKLWAMRLDIQPTSRIQIGFSRAMQFGGEGREENLSTLWDAFTSRSENTADGAGNQLGGMDIRYSFSWMKRSVAAYAQVIGEDEAGYLPTKRMYLFGLEMSQTLSDQTLLHNFIEWSDTTASALEGEDPNTSYTHFAYQTGYRYRTRVIGSSFENDTRTWTLGSSLYKSNGDQLKLMLTYAQLNRDGSIGGNLVSSSDVDAYFYEAEWGTILLGGKLTAGVSYLTEDTSTAFEGIDQANIYTGWTYRY